MSAITEARLAEIEAENLEAKIAWEVVLNGHVPTINKKLDEVTAEVRRLRECIAKAPHPQPVYGTGLRLFKQWQRQALGGEE